MNVSEEFAAEVIRDFLWESALGYDIQESCDERYQGDPQLDEMAENEQPRRSI